MLSNVTGTTGHAGAGVRSGLLGAARPRAGAVRRRRHRACEAQGVTRFLELGPDSVLAGMAGETASGTAELIPLLRRDQPEETALLTALARLHVDGAGVDWAALFAGTGARPVDLPTYAFQRQRYWPPVAGRRPRTGLDCHRPPAARRGRWSWPATASC